MSIYIGDKEIKNLYAGGSISISDMQGPAPDGFHIPLNTEWQGLKIIMNGLSLTTGDGWRINLHIPFAGGRDHTTNASIFNQGSYCYCRSSTPNSAWSARAIRLNSSYIGENESFYYAAGYSVRCFKNSYVTPTSSWTVIQGTLGSAGIFWNQSEGLISITDGSTGYTMMDKNLGATTVYNDGDALSENNCGKYYQWGNNYGFPRTGSVTTSSTQVDASSYGPGNYYNSSTFIIGSSNWSSVQNDNLWGGVSQGTTETGAVKAVYLGDTKVRPVTPPGPTMNYLAHYPLEGNLNDTSGNGRNGALTGSVSYTTLSSGKKVLSVNSSSRTHVSTSLTTAPATASVWIYKDPTNDPHPGYWKKFMGQDNDNYNGNWEVGAGWLFGYGDWQSWHLGYYLKSQDEDIDSYDLTQLAWTHLCGVYDGTTTHFYVNGVEIGTMAKPFIAQTAFYFLDTNFTGDASYRRYYGMMSEVCLLTNARSSSDVLDYYNATKSDYGL